MPTAGFEFAQRGGFHLQRFECYNWGTFNGRVWSVDLGGENGLLSGVNGSGKSTLADGLTTLLHASNRTVYNKAGGAESATDRTLYTYVRGKHKNVQDATGKKEVFLRGKNKYSVLLAHFRNKALGEDLTLAAVFYLLDETMRSPKRFYVTASRSLRIVEHFSDFGGDISRLKKRLKASEAVEVFDTFPKYSETFRQRLGLTPQGLDLFYQTVSLKSINSLTEFVREHMLPETAVQEQVQILCDSFDNLDRAHSTVVEARRKVEMLEPIAEEARRFEQEQKQAEALQAARDHLSGFFARQKLPRLERIIEEKDQEKGRADRKVLELEGDIERLRQAERRLDDAIRDQGGARLDELEKEIGDWEKTRDSRREEKKRLDEALRPLDLGPVRNAEDFRRILKEAAARKKADAADLDRMDDQSVALGVEHQAVKSEVDALDTEIASLRERQNNIPTPSLEIRRGISASLGIAETDLPFVGELLQVRAEASEWEGACERLLHSFGLSLLVPEEHYKPVSAYVERTALKGRLVYFRVRPDAVRRPVRPEPDSLVHKLEIKAGTPFYGWIGAQLAERFDYPCCADVSELQRLPKGVTRAGQVKHNATRHEKDDRRAIDDRSHFILGWSTKEKIRTLQGHLDHALKRQKSLKEQIDALAESKHTLHRRKEQTSALLSRFDDYLKVDFHGAAREIDKRQSEREGLLSKGGQLQALSAERDRTRGQLVQAQMDRKEEERRSLNAERDLNDRTNELQQARESIATLPVEGLPELVECIERAWEKSGADRDPTLINYHTVEQRVRYSLQQEIDNGVQRIRGVTNRIATRMAEFCAEFRAETTDLGKDMQSLPEYLQMLERLRTEDLPSHEQRFKSLLTTETIRGVALFLNFLERQKKDIEEDISTINASLRQIDYDAAKGTYVALIASDVVDEQISDFRTMLRNCLEESDGEREIYTEERFYRVKQVIALLRGESESERKHREKVIDVRNWCDYSASERYRESDEEREFYPDSSGKSGGQKEKLAYTVLASALAYQYRLESDRAFRFVLIDEAFSRASDDNSRYALELFKRLGLQLLVITPLQKTYVIEPYIRTVHYAINPSGEESLLSRLTVEELHQQREFRLAKAKESARVEEKRKQALRDGTEG